MKFRTLQKGAYASASSAQPSVMVARDLPTYRAIWGNVIGGEVPAVDFDRESVVFLIDRQRNTGGYSLVPEGVTFRAGKAVVKVTLRHPERGSVVTQVITSPFAVIAVAKAKLEAAEWVNAADGRTVASGPKTGDKAAVQ